MGMSFRRQNLMNRLKRRSTVVVLAARGIIMVRGRAGEEPLQSAAVFGCPLSKQSLDQVLLPPAPCPYPSLVCHFRWENHPAASIRLENHQKGVNLSKQNYISKPPTPAGV
jgi:hypothetical protein